MLSENEKQNLKEDLVGCLPAEAKGEFFMDEINQGEVVYERGE